MATAKHHELGLGWVQEQTVSETPVSYIKYIFIHIRDNQLIPNSIGNLNAKPYLVLGMYSNAFAACVFFSLQVCQV